MDARQLEVTQVQRLAPDVELETRLYDDGQVVHVAIVYSPGGSAARLVEDAVARARVVMRDAPEEVRHVEVRLRPADEEAIGAAARRRWERAKRRRAVH